MPYVKEQLRDRIQTQIDSIDWFLSPHELADRQSRMVAVLVEIVEKAMCPATGWRYHNLHRAYGVFAAAAAEAERRLPGQQAPDNWCTEWVSIADFQDDIEHIVYWVRHEDDDKHDGYLNYIVSMIAAQCMGTRFRPYVADTLRLAGNIFYSTVVAPYEDECIVRNGDIPPYKAFPCSA